MNMKNMRTYLYFTIACAVAVFIASCENPQDNKTQSHHLYVPNIEEIADGKYANQGYQSVAFGENTVNIGENAFKGNKITTLDLPSNLEHIGENAFKDNILKTVTFRSTKIKNLSTEMFRNKDGSLPIFLLLNEDVMEHVIGKFAKTNVDGTKEIENNVEFQTKDGESLSQQTIDNYIKKLTDTPSEVCTLIFMVDEKEHDRVTTPCGEAIAAKDVPIIPTKTHYTFYLWSSKKVSLGEDPGGGYSHSYVDSHRVENTEETLHASWKPKKYEVRFMKDDTATPHKVAQVDYKSTTTSPTEQPSREHYTFADWYKDTTHTQIFDFAKDTIQGTTTLYAKWTPKKYTVTFYIGEGISSLRGSSEVDYNSMIPPASIPADPIWSGIGVNTFAGWYKDTTHTQIFDFAKDTIQGPTALYGKWREPYHSVTFYAINESYFSLNDDGDEEYDSYIDYKGDDIFRHDVVRGSRIMRQSSPEGLDKDYEWPRKWFKIQLNSEESDSSPYQKRLIKTWIKGKFSLDETKLNRLSIKPFRFGKGDTITGNTILVGIIKVAYKATFIVDGKEVGAFPMNYKGNNNIEKMFEKNKFDLSTTIPKGFDGTNARFDGWYTEEDYNKKNKSNRLLKRYFDDETKRTNTISGKNPKKMYGRWIKTYTVSYQYKSNTHEKTLKDTADGLIVESTARKPKDGDEIQTALRVQTDKPRAEAPDGYPNLVVCWYSDEELNTVYDFPSLDQPTTKIYGAWKFAADRRTSRGFVPDCSDTRDPSSLKK